MIYYEIQTCSFKYIKNNEEKRSCYWIGLFIPEFNRNLFFNNINLRLLNVR